jgi:hypothetical protein
MNILKGYNMTYMRKKKPLLIWILILSFVLALLHLTFTKLSIYWSVWWADNLVHFVGGIVVALIGFWILYFSQKKIPASKTKSFVTIVAFVILIGILWEVFEYKAGIVQASIETYKLDTLHDLFSDLCGGIVGWFVCTSKKYFL